MNSIQNIKPPKKLQKKLLIKAHNILSYLDDNSNQAPIEIDGVLQRWIHDLHI